MGFKIGSVTIPDDTAGIRINGVDVGGISTGGVTVWRRADQPVPGATMGSPPSFSVEAGVSPLDLRLNSFTAVPDATSYEFRHSTGGGALTTIPRPNNFSFRITGLAASTTYDFDARTVYADGFSAWSENVQATTASDAMAPPAPALLIAEGYEIDGEYILGMQWAPSLTATSYEARIKQTSASNWTVVTPFTVFRRYFGPLFVDGWTAEIGNLLPGTSYDVQVRAVNRSGMSAWVARPGVTTPASSALPPQAPGLRSVPFALEHPDSWLTLDGSPLITIESDTDDDP